MCLRRCLILVGSLAIVTSYGQINIYYPNYFTGYYQNMSQISPAYTPESGRAEFAAGYKSLTGAFRKISSYYFTGSRSFQTEKEKIHTARLQFYNEKEGSYISSPRVYLNYSYAMPVSDQVSLYAGLAFGVIGAYYSAPITTQSSYTLPDGSLGVGVKSAWIDVGVSMMQALESTYAPVASLVTYKRYYHAYAIVQKKWDSEWGIKVQALSRILPSSSNEYYGAASFLYAHNLEMGASFRWNAGLSLFTLIGMGNEDEKIQLMINYNSPFFSQIPSWQSNVEIGLLYRL